MEKKKKKTRYVPHDLIIQILLKSPVMSLLRFKCFHKSWFSLISDPHFANSHFQITAATHTSRIPFMSSKLQKTLSLDFESKLHFTEIPSPNFFHTEYDIISSCRGFIFLHHSSKFHLIWNPCTGVHKQIPLSPFELDEDNLCYLHGFGYDKLRDDYVVVLVSYNCYSRVAFFSLKDNMWRKIKGTRFPYNETVSRNNWPRVGSLLNGNIHWLAENTKSYDNVILAFDITERKLFEMPYPDGIEYYRDEDCDLWVFGEFLSLWAKNYLDERVEIWVMKEYKVPSSWTKALILRMDVDPLEYVSLEYVSLICSTQSGNIVGADHTGLVVIYNNKGQPLEYESYSEVEFDFYVTAYTESLLSLSSNNVQA